MWRRQESGCRGNPYHPQIKHAQADLKQVRQRLDMSPSDLAGELPAGLDMPPKSLTIFDWGFPTPPLSPPSIVLFRKGIFPSYGIECAGVSQLQTEVMMVGWLKSSSTTRRQCVNTWNQRCLVSTRLSF